MWSSGAIPLGFMALLSVFLFAGLRARRKPHGYFKSHVFGFCLLWTRPAAHHLRIPGMIRFPKVNTSQQWFSMAVGFLCAGPLDNGQKELHPLGVSRHGGKVITTVITWVTGLTVYGFY